MPRPLSISDVATLDALPAHVREATFDLVRRAYFAGFDEAVRCAASDIALGMDWSHITEYRLSAAGLWLTDEAAPLFEGVDVGCEIDPIYSPGNDLSPRAAA